MNNDEQIREFFATHSLKPEENGFSERVMRRIPPRTPLWIRIARIVLPLAAAAIAFHHLDVMHIISNGLVNIIQWLAYARHTNINPLVIVSLLGLAAYGADKIKVFR